MVYCTNRHKLFSATLLLHFFSATFLLALSLSLAAARVDAAENTAEDAMRALARRVAKEIAKSSATIRQSNRSSADAKAISALGYVFRDELRNRGVKITAQNGETEIILSIADNIDGQVAIATLRRGKSDTSFLQSLQRSNLSTERAQGPQIRLQRELLFSRTSPVLDVRVRPAEPDRIEVLGENDFVRYKKENGAWTPLSSAQIPKSPDRDRQGTILGSNGEMKLIFPREICTQIAGYDAGAGKKSLGNLANAGNLSFSCSSRSDQNGISEISQQVLASKKSPPWKVAVEMRSTEPPAYLLRGSDGLLRAYEAGNDVVATFSGYGEQLAAINSQCSAQGELLATSAGDWSQTDELKVLAFVGNQFLELAPGIHFAGPVLALHGEDPGDGSEPARAIAVSRNLSTGQYEAYLLSILCSR